MDVNANCQPCDQPDIIKLPPCSNNCQQPGCKAFTPKTIKDISRKLFVWLYGAPSTGKSTLCSKLCPKYKLVRIHTGELLHKEVRSGSVRAKCIENIMSRGELVPNDVMMELISHEVHATDLKDVYGFIIDGYPRDPRQGMLFERKIGPVQLFLFLDGDKDEIIKRHLARAQQSAKRWPTDKRMDNCVAGKQQLKIFFDNHKSIIDQYPHKILRIQTCGKSPDEVANESFKIMDDIIKQHKIYLTASDNEKARVTNCLKHKNY